MQVVKPACDVVFAGRYRSQFTVREYSAASCLEQQRALSPVLIEIVRADYGSRGIGDPDACNSSRRLTFCNFDGCVEGRARRGQAAGDLPLCGTPEARQYVPGEPRYRRETARATDGSCGTAVSQRLGLCGSCASIPVASNRTLHSGKTNSINAIASHSHYRYERFHTRRDS